jgi:hypothetical protein
MPVIMFSSVDLPEPDLPITLTNSPAHIQVDAFRRQEIPAAVLILTTLRSWINV